VLNPVPINTLAHAGADIVVGVKLSPPAAAPSPHGGWRSLLRPPIIETVLRSFDVMQWKLTEQGAARADVTIEPLFDGSTGLRDWRRADEFIDAGRAAVEAVLPQLRARLALSDGAPPERLAA
jgi:NTE family protein